MLAGIEEREQSSWRGLITLLVTPIAQASICHAEVVFLEDCRLRLVGLGGDDEVVMDDGEFIQHQVVRCLVVIVGDRCNEKLRGRICEWIEFGLFRALLLAWTWFLCCWLLCQCWTVSQLKL